MVVRGLPSDAARAQEEKMSTRVTAKRNVLTVKGDEAAICADAKLIATLCG